MRAGAAGPPRAENGSRRPGLSAQGSICLFQFFKNGASVSIGIGKMVVEFFSAAISTSVCK